MNEIILTTIKLEKTTYYKLKKIGVFEQIWHKVTYSNKQGTITPDKRRENHFHGNRHP